jgi:ribosomal small subunit protein bTHX
LSGSQPVSLEIHRRSIIMGKGDKRSKRGKLFKGTFGKRRIRSQKIAKKAKPGTGGQG